MGSILLNRDGGSSTSHGVHTGGEIPTAGKVISAILSMLTIVLLSLLLSEFREISGSQGIMN